MSLREKCQLQPEWLIDSGCSNHMTYNKSLFTKLSEAPIPHVELGNGDKAAIMGSGTITMKTLVGGKVTPIKVTPIILENVLFIPELGYQHLSAPTLSKRGFSTLFENDRCNPPRNPLQA